MLSDDQIRLAAVIVQSDDGHLLAAARVKRTHFICRWGGLGVETSLRLKFDQRVALGGAQLKHPWVLTAREISS